VETIELLLLFFLAFIAAPIAIGFVMYYLPKKLGYPKFAKWLAIGYVIIVCLIGVWILFEDQLFTKSEAKKLLKEQNVIINNDFILMKNESMSAIGDYYHTFILEISQADKEQIIQRIKSAKYFKKIGETIVDFQTASTINRYEGVAQIQEYETESAFVTEFFKPNGKGYSPTFRRVTIEKIGKTLQFEDIDD